MLDVRRAAPLDGDLVSVSTHAQRVPEDRWVALGPGHGQTGKPITPRGAVKAVLEDHTKEGQGRQAALAQVCLCAAGSPTLPKKVGVPTP